MDTQIVAEFCLCDDMLKALHHHEYRQCQMNNAKVMTTAIVAVTKASKVAWLSTGTEGGLCRCVGHCRRAGC